MSQAVITLANGVVFERAADRIREYCEIEVYRDRDYRGGYDDHHNVTGRVTAEDLEAVNNLHSRLGSLDRGRITHSSEISHRLEAIRDDELGELEDTRWKDVKLGLTLLLESLLALPNVKLSEATKIMHLKRPHLIPILDPLVIEFLTGNDLERNIFSTGELLKIGSDSMDVIRSDLRRNKEAFFGLQAELADLPLHLTNVRLHGILCWTQEKWVNRGDTAGPFGAAKKSLNQRALAPAPVGDPVQGGGPPEIPGEIRNIKEYRQVKLKAEGVIVTTGSKPPRAHRPLCRELSEERFMEAIVFSEGKKGRYYIRNDLAEAARDFGAVACMKCKPERPIVRRD